MLTVAAVRTGTKYPLDYAQRLVNAVERNLTVPHRWLYVTDDTNALPDAPGLCVVPTREPGWWAKLELFKPSIPATGPILFFDLDSVIIGNLDRLAEWPEALVGMNDPNLAMMNSSVMRIVPGVAPDVWEHYGRDASVAKFKYRWGDQHLITRVAEDRITYWPHNWVVLYKTHCNPHPPEGACVVQFAGSPKPHDAIGIPWVAENWR